MGYGFEIPSSVQPGDVNIIPGQRTPISFGEMIGGQPPQAQAQQQAAPQEMPPESMAAPEPQQPGMTFGDMIAQRQETRPSAFGTPGKFRDPQAENQKESAAVDKTVQQLNQTLSKSEKGAQNEAITQQENDNLISEIQGLIGDSPVALDQIDDNAPSNPHLKFTPEWFKAEVMNKGARFRASFGDNKKEELAAAKSMYENDKGGRAEMRDGVIYFRTSAKEKMRRLDDKALEFVSDLLIDNAGMLTEGTVAAGTEAGLLGLGAAETATGVAAPVGVGTMAGASMVAGAAGAGAKTAAKMAMDAMSAQKQLEEDHSIVSDMAWGAGLNVATIGLMKGGGATAKAIGSTLKNSLATGQSQRIAQLAQIRVQFENYVKEVGQFPSVQGLKEAGKRAFGVIDDLGNQLADNVSMVKQKAIQLSEERGIKKVSTKNLLDKMKQNLDNRFVDFDEKGYAKLAGSEAEKANQWAEGISGFGERGEQFAGDVQGASQQELLSQKTLTNKAFGAEGGSKALSKMVQDYNMLLASEKGGGVPIKVLFDHIEAYRQQADLEKVLLHSDQQTAVYRELQHAAANDRHAGLQQILGGSGVPEEEMYNKAFSQYAERIDDVLEFRKIFGRKESANQFAEALVQPGNSERIIKLKGILGENSKEWNTFRGEYMDKFISDSLDPNTGILQTKNINKRFYALGRDVVNEMFSQGEQKRLMQIVHSAGKVPFSDLVGAEQKEALRETLIALSPIQQFASTRFRMVWNLFGKSKQAVDYLLDEGYMQAARSAATKEQRDAILQLQSFTKEAVTKMKTVSVSRTNPKTGKQILREMYVPATAPIARQGVIQAGKELGKPSERDPGADPTMGVELQ